MSRTHTRARSHKCLPHPADPSLYWREALSLALLPLNCNYRHLSSMCLIYSQLKNIPKKWQWAVLYVGRMINVLK